MRLSDRITVTSDSDLCVLDRFDEIETENGVLLRISDIHFDEDASFEVLIDWLSFSCVLDGQFEGHVDGLPEIVGDRSQLRIFYWNGDRPVHLSYSAGTHLRSVQLLLSPDYVRENLASETGAISDTLKSALTPGDGSYYIDQRRLPPGLRVIAEQVLRCNLTGVLRDTFYRGKALELLAMALAELQREEPSKQAILLSAADVERIREAREILLENRISPPTLAQLSRSVGLNEFKLKQGFRFVFNTTAYALLNMDRMQEAERLLREDKLNVAQVSYKVGYTSNAAFSRAFRRYFGYPPSAILRNSAIVLDQADATDDD